MMLKDSVLKGIFNFNMDQILNIVSIRYSDNEINKIIEKCKDQQNEYTMHFSQNEDFFLKIGKEITVPHLKVHHNIKDHNPAPGYTAALSEIIEQMLPYVSSLIKETYYYFDPAEPLRPVFYRLYDIEGHLFLYMVRIDLSFKPHDCEIVEMGGNDITHIFSTNNVFIDIDMLPVEKTVDLGDGKKDFIIKQSISQTWIGETGRGYFIQGIWMDSELTRFFTRLFLPENIHSYPYYPFACKYRTISHFPLRFSMTDRRRHLGILERSYNFIDPFMREIEDELKNSVYSPDMKLFKELKKKVNKDWYIDFSSLNIKRYLNSRGMKEYEFAI